MDQILGGELGLVSRMTFCLELKDDKGALR